MIRALPLIILLPFYLSASDPAIVDLKEGDRKTNSITQVYIASSSTPLALEAQKDIEIKDSSALIPLISSAENAPQKSGFSKINTFQKTMWMVDLPFEIAALGLTIYMGTSPELLRDDLIAKCAVSITRTGLLYSLLNNTPGSVMEAIIPFSFFFTTTPALSLFNYGMDGMLTSPLTMLPFNIILQIFPFAMLLGLQNSIASSL